MKYNLSFSAEHYSLIKNHLYPGDGCEAVAIALCGRQKSEDQERLLVHEVIPIPYSECFIRKPDIINWSTKIIVPYLEKAAKKGFAILKIHSHPTGYPEFSVTDNRSDKDLFTSIYGWMDNDRCHASAVMLPDGRIFGRIVDTNINFHSIDKINVAGDDILIWYNTETIQTDEFALRTRQAFGEGTVNRLKRMKVGIVGCSGTGSPVIEQLVRLGVGHILLIDPDIVEKKNLNRIINTTIRDAHNKVYKVTALKRAIKKIGIGTIVDTYNQNIFSGKKVINALAGCDIIFGCVDSVDGRHLLNQIGTFYLIPYFDLGVKLISDKKGGIEQIFGSVHYLKPGGSSLRTRGVYDSETLRAATMYRTDLENYNEQKKSGYIVDIQVDSPAVISINTNIASLAVIDFLARIHPFRYDKNSDFAITRVSYTDAFHQFKEDGDPDEYLKKFVGRGDMVPLLNTTEIK